MAAFKPVPGGDDETLGKPPTETSVQYQRRRYKEAGLVQINVWVPAGDKTRVLVHCYRLRKEFLRNTDIRP